MASLDQNYTSPLAAITQATRDNAQWPKSFAEQNPTIEIPKSVDLQIDFTRWNKLYPYALVMATPTRNFGDVLTAFGGDRKTATAQLMEAKEAVFYKESARFVLPIPPEQLTIQTPYAIQVSKTLRGVVEEHNADPFRILAFTGTTGVNPIRHTSTTTRNNSLVGGIVQAATQTSAALGFGSTTTTAISDDVLQGTGYAQFRLLETFLQTYVRLKASGNPNLRLLFVAYKDQKAYVVTPMQFTLRREAGRALKYRYDLQFRAWKEVPSRRVLSGGGIGALLEQVSTGNLLTKAIDTLNQARKVIAGAVSLVRNVRGAVTRLLDIVRQVALAVKEAIGALISLIDLPGQIIKDCKAAFRESWDSIKSAWDDLGDSIDQAKADLGIKRGGTIVGAVDKYFNNPSSLEAIEFLSRADISRLTLPTAIQDAIDTERTRVAAFTNKDYAVMRDEVRSLGVQIADAVGASSAVYDTTYQNVHPTITREPTSGDFDVLYAVNDILKTLNGLSQQPSRFPSTMEYVAGFASKSGMAFNVPTSKFPVPFPYDYTLEELARDYLGNPDRWIEIATLNGLREPYVDEVGFTLPLIGNGKLSEIPVASATNLIIGQPIWIQSNSVNREKRHILNINVVGPGNVVLTLDGDSDLDKYVAIDNPYVQAFLPDTVNSHQVIYIPSDKPAANSETLKSIPGVDAFDNLLEVGGIDLLLKNDNDLAITDDGDCRIAFGMANLVQRARVALATPRGALIRHPNFGLPIKVGMSVADLDIKELKSAVADLFAEDPSFDGVSSVSVFQNAATLQIGLGLAVTGQDHPIAVNFQVLR